jgi:ABC-type Fe3+-hydroxamate transport system substrate-binding protein
VKVSSRNVLQLLAGTLGVQQFQAGLGGRNPFAEKLLRGQLIKSVLIEPSEVAEEDDDWIVFEFGEPDPAISPFRQRP